jgi:hypothetical protein
MNHKSYQPTTLCHPERSLANHQRKSRDPAPVESATGDASNFRVAVRFIDDQGTCGSPVPFGFGLGRLQCRVSKRAEGVSGPDATIKP